VVEERRNKQHPASCFFQLSLHPSNYFTSRTVFSLSLRALFPFLCPHAPISLRPFLSCVPLALPSLQVHVVADLVASVAAATLAPHLGGLADALLRMVPGQVRGLSNPYLGPYLFLPRPLSIPT